MTTRRGMVRAVLGGMLGALFAKAQATANAAPMITPERLADIKSRVTFGERTPYGQWFTVKETGVSYWLPIY
jgi:hypothetical protein